MYNKHILHIYERLDIADTAGQTRILIQFLGNLLYVKNNFYSAKMVDFVSTDPKLQVVSLTHKHILIHTYNNAHTFIHNGAQAYININQFTHTHKIHTYTNTHWTYNHTHYALRKFTGFSWLHANTLIIKSN